MTQLTPVKTETTPTTTLHIKPIDDESILAEQFRLVRYVLPDNFAYSKSKHKWARMHNSLKENLNAPYKVYTHDTLDGSNCWAIYVLYSRDHDSKTAKEIPEIIFEDEALPGRELTFNEPEHHVLVKLLQIAYFDSSKLRRGHFVGQDKCYIYAKRRGVNSRYHICLQINVRGDRHNNHVFYVYGQAKTLAKVKDVKPEYISRKTYFSISDVTEHGTQIREVKSSAVLNTSPLYEQRTFSGSNTQLKFHHAQDDIEKGRGYLIDVFIRNFVTYLRSFNFNVEHIEREFHEYDRGAASDFKLPVHQLERVLLYDARFQRSESLKNWENQLESQFPDLDFQWIDELDETLDEPVIIFQDAEARAFQSDRPLHGINDPHEIYYRRYPGVPKQFVNVNVNSPEKNTNQDDYLDYFVDPAGADQVEMILNQLFLKDTLLQQRNVRDRLPLAPEQIMFVHKENRGKGEEKQGYEIALYFDNGQAHFLDIRTSLDDRKQFYDYVDALGIDWDEHYEEMEGRHGKSAKHKEITSYDVIVGPGFFVEIGDPDEALLYEYETIIERLEEYRDRHEIDDLKLAHRYDEIIDDQHLSEDWLIMQGYLADPDERHHKIPATKKHARALELYQAFKAYDRFLDSLKRRYDSLSFGDLISESDIAEQINELFGSSHKLRNHYKKIDRFRGPRESDVIPVYRGIWYTDDLRYVVGDSNAMNSSQATANRVRQFIVYEGNEAFNIASMLEAMSVQFVRLRQYTVYPYYFHLISLYIDNYARYT